MAKNDVAYKRSKHIDLRYHMVGDYIRTDFFALDHVKSEYNRANVMTKALERIKHELHTNALLTY